MERDMDLIREILLRVEQHKPWEHGGECLRLELSSLPQQFQSAGEKELSYHIFTMQKEGLIDSANPSLGLVGDLTWKGHDYLDEIRDPKWFEKLKKHIDPKRPHTLAYLRKINTKIRQAHDQFVIACLVGIMHWIGFSLIAWFWWR